MNYGLSDLQRSVATIPIEYFWFSLFLIISVATFCGFKAFRSIAYGRLIASVPTSKVRSAAQGYVELIGYAELMEGLPIIAPTSGRQCVWYRYRVEKYQRAGKRRYWKVVEQGVSDGLFLLKDETGYCIIDPENAAVSGPHSRSWRGSHRSPMSMPTKKSFLDRWMGLGRYRYTESRLEEFDSLYAIGDFQSVGRGENLSCIKNEVRDLIAKWKHDSQQREKFDANQDGQIDLEEWEQLRKAAHQEVLKNQLEQPIAPAVHMMKQPSDGRPYLLSTRDPVKLIRNYRWASAAFLSAAMSLGALAVYMVNIRLIM